MSFNDVEYLVLFALMAVFFLTGLRKRDNAIEGRFAGIVLPMSTALKGIACVLILMGHFASRMIDMGQATIPTRLVYLTTANVALALFMYFSGYGLSVKKSNGGGYLSTWYRRLKKVYLPLLITCVIAMVLYAILPVKFSLYESKIIQLPQDIWYIHNLSQESWGVLLPHLFGWKDWYVFCIIIFYLFFYLSRFLSRSNTKNQTWILWLMFLAYYVFAYYYFGKAEAHWYRYCWAFFLGHVHGKMVQSGKTNKWYIAMMVVLLATIPLESRFMKLSYVIAVLIVAICAFINKRYTMNSRVLSFMGGISYFFYLSHERIGSVIMAYTGVYSVVYWVLMTIVVSALLNILYKSSEGMN